MDVCDNIAKLNMLVFKNISKRNKELGLDITPVQAIIIKTLYEHDNLNQKDMEQFVTCNKSTLSSILDTMEKNGLIIRCDDKSDSRKKIISLTNKSIEIASILKKDELYIKNKICNNINSNEIYEFNNIINKMIDNLGGNE